jgi:response regulator NasT
VIGGSESELLARATERGLERLLASDERLDDAIDLALKQVAELARLRTVTARLAQVERAKGILMERHKVTERDAHERLRRHARKLNAVS